MTVSPADAGSWRRAEQGVAQGARHLGSPALAAPLRAQQQDGPARLGLQQQPGCSKWKGRASGATAAGRGVPPPAVCPPGATAARPPPLPPPAAWPACRLLPPLRAEGILLAFRNAIDNWEDVYEGRQLQGWAACEPGRCVPVCSWSGVTCDPYVQGDDDNRVTAV